MAASPSLKIYNPQGEYVASCKHAEDAAALVELNGDGSKIKYEHKYEVWVEGKEKQPAGESYDFVADTIAERIEEVNATRGKVRSWHGSK